MPQVPPDRPLNQKELQYVELRAKGLNKYASAVAAGYSHSMAKVAEAKIESRPLVQETLRQALERAGVTADKLATTLSAGLSATRTIHASDKGVITDTRQVEDFTERRQTVELIAKLRGDLSDGLNLTVNQVMATIPQEFAEFMAVTPEDVVNIEARPIVEDE